MTSLLTSLSLAHLAPRLLLNGFDTVPRLQNLSTEDLNFLEVSEDQILCNSMLAFTTLAKQKPLLSYEILNQQGRSGTWVRSVELWG